MALPANLPLSDNYQVKGFNMCCHFSYFLLPLKIRDVEAPDFKLSELYQVSFRKSVTIISLGITYVLRTMEDCRKLCICVHYNFKEHKL